MLDSTKSYGPISRLFHWGMALLLLWQFLTVGARAWLTDSALDEFMWATHRPLGALLLLLVVIRLVWALRNRSRRPASVSLAAKLGHITLYALLLVVPLLALLRQYGAGRAFDPFGIPLFSGFDGRIEWLVAPGNLLHGSLGWTLMALVAGHIFMVVWHRRAGRVNVLPRMWGKQ